MDSAFRQILPFLVPILAMLVGLPIAMFWIWTEHRRMQDMVEMHHKERMLAIERGQELPPLPADFFRGSRNYGQDSPTDELRSGLLLFLMGVALTVALGLTRSVETAAWGLMPVAWGLALVIHAIVVRRNRPLDVPKEAIDSAK